MSYVEGMSNTEYTLKIYGDRAIMTSKFDDSDTPDDSFTLYEIGDNCVNTYILYESGGKKAVSSFRTILPRLRNSCLQ